MGQPLPPPVPPLGTPPFPSRPVLRLPPRAFIFFGAPSPRTAPRRDGRSWRGAAAARAPPRGKHGRGAPRASGPAEQPQLRHLQQPARGSAPPPLPPLLLQGLHLPAPLLEEPLPKVQAAVLVQGRKEEPHALRHAQLRARVPDHGEGGAEGNHRGDAGRRGRRPGAPPAQRRGRARPGLPRPLVRGRQPDAAVSADRGHARGAGASGSGSVGGQRRPRTRRGRRAGGCGGRGCRRRGVAGGGRRGRSHRLRRRRRSPLAGGFACGAVAGGSARRSAGAHSRRGDAVRAPLPGARRGARGAQRRRRERHARGVHARRRDAPSFPQRGTLRRRGARRDNYMHRAAARDREPLRERPLWENARHRRRGGQRGGGLLLRRRFFPRGVGVHRNGHLRGAGLCRMRRKQRSGRGCCAAAGGGRAAAAREGRPPL